jgi:hypothetical protein
MEDTTAPEIQSLILSSSQINLSQESTIQVTMRLTDLESGIGNNQLLNAEIRWRSPSKNQFVDAAFYETSSGSNNDSIFIDGIDFNEYAEEGEWEIEYASVTDNAGNHKWLYPAELKNLSLNSPITVLRSANSTPTNEPDNPLSSEKDSTLIDTNQETQPSPTNYIDQSGNTFLIAKQPTEEELSGWGYSNSMNHGSKVISAIYNDKEIPLWYSFDDENRLSEVTAGYAYVIEQAEFDSELGDIVTVSTRGSWIGNEKAITTPESQDYDYYAIHRYSAETGHKKNQWNFSDRKWGANQGGYATMFPNNGDWDLIPETEPPIRPVFEELWPKAVEDFPDFFDKTKGLKKNISLDDPIQGTGSNPITEQDLLIKAPSKFNKKSADKITNFNPSTDTLEIETASFGIDSSATFAAGKNKREVKKLAKQDFDFLYDEKKGGLYFNENGADKGFGDGGIIAILKGAPDLTSSNLEFI